MAETILKSIDDGSARFVPRPFIYTKNTWPANWNFWTDLIIESATLCAGAQDIDTLVFRRKYGLHILPDQVAAQEIDPLQYAEGMWVKLAIEVQPPPEEDSEELPPVELKTVWVGQVAAVTPVPQGSSASGPYGEQVFTCYGPAEILRKTHLSKSLWQVESIDEEKHAFCQWLAKPNDMWGRGVGNRSENEIEIAGVSTYIFGGSKRWTCLDFATYLVRRFVSSEEIEWNIVGDAVQSLDYMDLRPEYCAGFGDTSSVWDLLHAVIRPDCGLDFFIRLNEGDPSSESSFPSFEIVVFSLVSKDITVGQTTFSKNPNTLKVESGGGHDFLRLDLVKTDEYRYSKIRLFGDRILLCTTLWGDNVKKPENAKDFPLETMWEPSAQTEYDEAVYVPEGESEEDYEEDAVLNDVARTHSRFADVYTKYGAKKTQDVASLKILPQSDEAGVVIFPETDGPDYQWIDRVSANFVPIFADEEEPVDYGEADPDELEKKDPLSPLVWILAENEESETDDDEMTYRLAHEVGLSVTPLPDWFGVRVVSKPQHLIAGEWSGSETEIEPQWNYKDLVATIAFKTDQRAFLEYDTGDAGQVLEEVFPQIQCWAIAPGTALAFDGKEFKIVEEGIVVRNDVKKLEQIMAAKAARYQARGKAVVELFAMRPVGEYLGTILSTVKEDIIEHEVNAPVTKITLTWRGSNNATTTISAGYPS